MGNSLQFGQNILRVQSIICIWGCPKWSILLIQCSVWVRFHSYVNDFQIIIWAASHLGKTPAWQHIPSRVFFLFNSRLRNKYRTHWLSLLKNGLKMEQNVEVHNGDEYSFMNNLENSSLDHTYEGVVPKQTLRRADINQIQENKIQQPKKLFPDIPTGLNFNVNSIILWFCKLRIFHWFQKKIFLSQIIRTLKCQPQSIVKGFFLLNNTDSLLQGYQFLMKPFLLQQKCSSSGFKKSRH